MSRQQHLAMRWLPFAVFFAALLLAYFFEMAYMPVIDKFLVSDVRRGGGVVTVSGTFHKNRNCKFLTVEAFALAPGGDSNGEQIPVKFMDNPVNSRENRPIGNHQWGPWRLTLPINPQSSAVKLRAIHQCHPLWTQTTELATVPLLYSEDVK